MEALKEYFGGKDDEMPVQGSRQINDMIMMYCHLMESPDVGACQKAKHQGGAMVESEKDGQKFRWVGPVGKEGVTMPEFVIHGTTVQGALGILKDRTTICGDGVCGFGQYAFRLESDDPEHAIEIYNAHTRRSGYGGCAAVIQAVDGILINGDKNYIIPRGAHEKMPTCQIT